MQLIQGRSLAACIAERQAEMASAILQAPRNPEGKAPSAILVLPSWDYARPRRLSTLIKRASSTATSNPPIFFFDERDELWITDFGLALFQTGPGVTLSGELVGTLRYMSPEQALAKRGLIDHRTDIYSLGATLYEMLTLQPVFSGQDGQELLYQIASQEPIVPRSLDRTIAVDLETILMKVLAKNPSERYGIAGELADDLQRFLEHKPILGAGRRSWTRRPSGAAAPRAWSSPASSCSCS